MFKAIKNLFSASSSTESQCSTLSDGSPCVCGKNKRHNGDKVLTLAIRGKAYPMNINGKEKLDGLHICVNTKEPYLFVKLYAVSGKNVLTQKVTDHSGKAYDLNLNGLNPGVYYMETKCGSGTVRQKIIVE